MARPTTFRYRIDPAGLPHGRRSGVRGLSKHGRSSRHRRLSEPLYQRLARRAQRARRTVEAELADAVATFPDGSLTSRRPAHAGRHRRCAAPVLGLGERGDGGTALCARIAEKLDKPVRARPRRRMTRWRSTRSGSRPATISGVPRRGAAGAPTPPVWSRLVFRQRRALLHAAEGHRSVARPKGWQRAFAAVSAEESPRVRRASSGSRCAGCRRTLELRNRRRHDRCRTGVPRHDNRLRPMDLWSP